MPRRVHHVSLRDAELHGLADPEKLRQFLRPRIPDLDDWECSLYPGHGDDLMVVLDHRDPDRPMHLLAHHRPGGVPHVHVHRGVVTCAEPGCGEEAISGTTHCPAHLRGKP